MKNVKVIKKAAIFLMVFVLAFSSLSAAAAVTYKTGNRTVRYRGANYKVYYNSKRVNSVTRPSLMINGNIMIPYHYTMVKRGPKVSVSKANKGKTITLSANGNRVRFYLNKKYIKVNGKKERIRTAPVKAKIGGASLIMLPARVAFEELGFHYTYNKSKKAIYVTGNTTTTNAPASTPIVNEPAVNTGLQATAFKNMSTQEFINAVGPIAREDYRKTGVLASVTLAQAINESGWGKSGLTQNSNNMFGMKTSLSGNSWSGSVWDGRSYVEVKTREEYNGKKVTITAKFRKYPSVAQSIADHSVYLSNAMNGARRRYDGLTDTKSYFSQLTILQKGGYCTWSGYVSELTTLIKKYDLTKWDN